MMILKDWHAHSFGFVLAGEIPILVKGKDKNDLCLEIVKYNGGMECYLGFK